jgi:hypothetical protein
MIFINGVAFEKVGSQIWIVSCTAPLHRTYTIVSAYFGLTWSSFSTCKTAKVAIADGQTFSDSIDKKSAGNLNLYDFDAI